MNHLNEKCITGKLNSKLKIELLDTYYQYKDFYYDDEFEESTIIKLVLSYHPKWLSEINTLTRHRIQLTMFLQENNFKVVEGISGRFTSATVEKARYYYSSLLE